MRGPKLRDLWSRARLRIATVEVRARIFTHKPSLKCSVETLSFRITDGTKRFGDLIQNYRVVDGCGHVPWFGISNFLHRATQGFSRTRLR